MSDLSVLTSMKVVCPKFVPSSLKKPDDVEPPSPSPTTPNNETNLESENARLHSLWDERMKDKGGNGLPHEKTAVLLISWHESLDELKVDGEIHRLHTTFKLRYNYTVTRKYIMPGKIAQNQISKFLADFVYQHDDEKTLLIIYYAGHGIGGKPGQLVLTA